VSETYGTTRRVTQLLYTDDLKLRRKSEDELREKIRIVQTISKDIEVNFGLEKCPRIYLKNDRLYKKRHIENTMENEIKELNPRKHRRDPEYRTKQEK
jgi:hypothetical protein